MVSRASTLLLVALTARSSSASMLSGSPVTDVAPNAALNGDHPAMGEDLPATSPAFRLVEDREAANATDLARLESYFQMSFERQYTKLPLSGEISPMPWPSGYWPLYLDGINHEWSAKGDASPAEKYARAFGLNVETFMTQVSEANGVLSKKSRQACSADADCAALNDGSACGKRKNATSGFCIPRWFGICHAWAPAAIMEPEPKCSVTMNNVEFKPLDIKALLTEVYDGSDLPTVFTGSRFNGNGSEVRDEYGRHPDPRYRDLDPGFFHIAVTNILGKLKKSFIVDVTAGREVWNQPVRSYNVLELTPMTLAHGAATLFGAKTYPFNSAAASLVRVVMRFSWIVEALEDGPLLLTQDAARYTKSADYSYVLELDNDNRIIGGEWTEGSLVEHPDFLWFPQTAPSLDAMSKVGISYKNVRQLLEQSVKGECLGSSGAQGRGGGPGTVTAANTDSFQSTTLLGRSTAFST